MPKADGEEKLGVAVWQQLNFASARGTAALRH